MKRAIRRYAPENKIIAIEAVSQSIMKRIRVIKKLNTIAFTKRRPPLIKETVLSTSLVDILIISAEFLSI